MDDVKVCPLPDDVEHPDIAEDSVDGVRDAEEITEKITVLLLEMFYSAAVTYFVGRWAVASAYAARGYKAYGGEYILIMLAMVLSYCFIHRFFRNFRRKK